jgi:hypothetical protein
MKKAFYSVERCPPSSLANVGLYMACCITGRFNGQIPTREALQGAFSMSKSTACRWINGFQAARGCPSPAILHAKIHLACRIALRFKDETPTWQAVAVAFSLSKSQACRSVAALKAARGQL